MFYSTSDISFVFGHGDLYVIESVFVPDPGKAHVFIVELLQTKT